MKLARTVVLDLATCFKLSIRSNMHWWNWEQKWSCRSADQTTSLSFQLVPPHENCKPLQKLSKSRWCIAMSNKRWVGTVQHPNELSFGQTCHETIHFGTLGHNVVVTTLCVLIISPLDLSLSSMHWPVFVHWHHGGNHPPNNTGPSFAVATGVLVGLVLTEVTWVDDSPLLLSGVGVGVAAVSVPVLPTAMPWPTVSVNTKKWSAHQHPFAHWNGHCMGHQELAARNTKRFHCHCWTIILHRNSTANKGQKTTKTMLKNKVSYPNVSPKE